MKVYFFVFPDLNAILLSAHRLVILDKLNCEHHWLDVIAAA